MFQLAGILQLVDISRDAVHLPGGFLNTVKSQPEQLKVARLCRVNFGGRVRAGLAYRGEDFTGYPKGCMVEYGKHSKRIAHELVLNYICNNETWPVKLNGKEYVLKISAAIDEYFITDIRTREECLVDCHMFLTTKSELYKETGGRLGIEVTHPIWWTKFFKTRKLEKFDLTVFELKMLPEWHVADPVNFTTEEIEQLQGKITDYLNSGAKLTCLFKPGYARL